MSQTVQEAPGAIGRRRGLLVGLNVLGQHVHVVVLPVLLELPVLALPESSTGYSAGCKLQIL